MAKSIPWTKETLQKHIDFTAGPPFSTAARYHREALQEVLRLQGYQEMMLAVLRRIRRSLPADDAEAIAIDRLLQRG